MAITEKDALLKDRKLGVTVINNRLDLPKYGKRTDNTIHRTTVESQKKFVEIEWFYGVLVVVALNLVLQAVISIGSHSGFGQPPLHGDYEAQRHWMEVTINLPIKEWYFNTSDNDLNYWGLDYPPLTAYHSWLMGKISYLLNPEWSTSFL
uniref:Alpha-1,3-glucosyltransferase n=1 Tax=Acrobeloides nanus TaxID=290746 RepID=A0A914CGR0_9BILA